MIRKTTLALLAGLALTGTTQQLCVNLTGTTISSRFLDIWIEWQEY